MVCSAGTTDLSCLRTSSRCAVSRHQPFGCDRWATSCAGVSLSMRGCVRSSSIAGTAGWPGIATAAGPAGVPGNSGVPSKRRRQMRP